MIKVMKCGLLKLHSKYDKMNIYETRIHILKKETFDFGMLNVTVYLFGCLFGYSLSQINIFFNKRKSFIKKSLKYLITISTTPFIKFKTPDREVSKYVRLGNTQQSDCFHEII